MPLIFGFLHYVWVYRFSQNNENNPAPITELQSRTPSATMAEQGTIACFGTTRDVPTGASEHRDWPPDEERGELGSYCDTAFVGTSLSQVLCIFLCASIWHLVRRLLVLQPYCPLPASVCLSFVPVFCLRYASSAVRAISGIWLFLRYPIPLAALIRMNNHNLTQSNSSSHSPTFGSNGVFPASACLSLLPRVSCLVY